MKLLARSLNKAFNYIAGATALIIALFYEPNWKAPGKWFIVVIAIVIWLIAALVAFIITIWGLTAPPMPKVLNSRTGRIPGHDNALILLLTPSEWLSVESLVSVYYAPDEFEQYVASGWVLVVQNDRRIQVVLNLSEIPQNDDIRERLLHNDKNVLQKLIIKPTIPRSAVERFSLWHPIAQ